MNHTNHLPYNILFNIFHMCDGSSRKSALQVSKSWNEASQCFELLRNALTSTSINLQLIKVGKFFFAAIGNPGKKLTKLFYMNLQSQVLEKIVDDNRTTIVNLFSAANQLLVQYPRGLKLICRRKKGIKEMNLLAKEPSKTRVESINNSFIALKSLTKETSHITILASRTGKQILHFIAEKHSHIKLEEDMLLISQKNIAIRYSLTTNTILDKIYFKPKSRVIDLDILSSKLSCLVQEEDQEGPQIYDFDI